MTTRRAWRRTALAVGLLAVMSCRTSRAPSDGSRTNGIDAADVAPVPSRGCRAGTLPALGGVARAITVGGESRRYVIDAAAGAGDRPRPVVLAFHGFGHSAGGFRSGTGLVGPAAAGDLIAIHADGRDDVRLLERVDRGWDIAPDETRDTAFVTALLDAVEGERCVDLRRIYAMGFSNGGFFSNLLACTLASRLAAVAAVAGARPLDDCRPASPVPIMFFHGAADPLVPPRLTTGAAAWWRRANRCGDGDEPRGGCRAARGCAADVVVCTGPQGHAWPTDATVRILDFFRDHARGG